MAWQLEALATVMSQWCRECAVPLRLASSQPTEHGPSHSSCDDVHCSHLLSEPHRHAHSSESSHLLSHVSRQMPSSWELILRWHPYAQAQASAGCPGNRVAHNSSQWLPRGSRQAPGSTHAASEHAQHWLIASSCRLCIHAAGAVRFKAFSRSSEQPGAVWHTANSDGHIAASRFKGGKG